MLYPAQITASHGRHHWVRIVEDGALRESENGPDRADDGPRMHAGDERLAVVRGRQTGLCVGDRVRIRLLDAQQAVIEDLLPRTTLLQRSDERRTRLLAANIGQAAIVLAGEPRFSEELLVRMMIALEAAGIDLAVIANKADLHDARQRIAPRLAVLRGLAYPVFELSALAGQAPAPGGTSAQAAAGANVGFGDLAHWLSGHTTLLLGESGMGKSTLVNALVPEAQVRTQEISRALGSGRHTTTFSRLFPLAPEIATDARIVDSPGFQNFGLWHLSPSERLHAMRDFAGRIGRCRFKDCTHRDEPGCALREAAQQGEIDALRYQLFVGIDLAERARPG